MVTIHQSSCIGCGQCVNDCIARNIKLQDGKAAILGPCFSCGHCVAICPSGAVSIPEYEMADVEAYDQGSYSLDIDRLLHVVKFRRSIRQYGKQPVEREKLERIIQAGRYTATGSNRQACRFVLVQEGLPTLKELVWDGIGATKGSSGAASEPMLSALHNFADLRAQGIDYLFRDAPMVLYVAAESAVDAALAAQNMELAAISQGLGMLYNGFLVYAANMLLPVREWLDIADRPAQVCMLVGYPKVSYQRTAPRKPADVRWR